MASFTVKLKIKLKLKLHLEDVAFFLFHMQNKIVIDVNKKTSRLKQALRKCKYCVTEGEEARKVA